MRKIRVGIAGYGTIGQRLADGVAMQEDMELVGIADLAPTLSLQALRERDMIGANGVRYNLYLVDGADKAAFEAKDIPVAGSFDELCQKVDIMLDSAPAASAQRIKKTTLINTASRPSSRAARRTPSRTCSSMAMPTTKRASARTT